MANLFDVLDSSILATASITITDETDAANLAGNISVISGGKNQIYMTGEAAPFSPDWSKRNLVLRPYCIASTVLKPDITGLSSYNPDLFDPKEYPDLQNPGDPNVTSSYIRELKWYIKDMNGVETEIVEDEYFTFSYTHDGKTYSDHRYLVFKNNYLAKDTFVTVVCKFNYYDPFAKIFIPQTYMMDITCISTGQGTNQLIISSVNGTSMYNSKPEYIELYVSYYNDGVRLDVQNEIENPQSSTSLLWYKRTLADDGWVLLDSTTQDSNEFNTEDIKCYEIRRYTSIDSLTGAYVTQKTNSARGGFMIRIYPALIKSSDIIKAVITDSNKGGAQYAALEVVYDTTDTVQAFIASSSGDKLYKGIENTGTILTCMVNYQGELLENGDYRYGDDDEIGNADGKTGIFKYYWFRMSQDGTETHNIYRDFDGNIQMQLVTPDTEMISGPRSLNIDSSHVDNLNMFQCIITDKVAESVKKNLYNLEKSLPTEENIIVASSLNESIGLDPNDIEETIFTAYELNNQNNG